MNSLSLIGVIFTALSIHGAIVPLNSDAWGQMQSGMNTFGANLMKAAAKELSGNHIYSPWSLQISLGMAYIGAGGITKSEIQNAIGLPSNDDDTKNGYKNMIETSKNITGLNAGNKIYASKIYQVNNHYQEMLESYFHSKFGTFDSSNPAQSAHDMNKWVAEETKDHIQNFIDPGQLTADTALILLNAVYYENEWAIPFDPTKTTSEPFYFNEGEYKNVKTMHATGMYSHGLINELEAKYIELKYKDDKTSMLFIVPENSYNVSNILENLNKFNFNNIPRNPTQVKISIPKFECSSKISWKPFLQQFNIKSMFENSADFNGMLANDTPIKVTDVQQQSHIKVNEKGSEAAAVTGIQLETMSIPPNVEFKVNTPFYYALLSKDLGVPLFMGYIYDPSQSA